MARFSALSGDSADIGRYLLMKWAAVLFFTVLIVWSIMRLGTGLSKDPKKRADKTVVQNDPYLKRLEKFKTKESLRSKSDIVIESRKKGKSKER